MSNELKPVPTTPVVVNEEENSPETMYCWIYDKNENVLGCPAKSSESSCQAYAQSERAAFYSYKTRSCK